MGGTFYSAFAATGRLRIACVSSSFQWLTERLRRIRSFDMVEKGWTLSSQLKKLPVVAGLCVLLLVSLLAIRTFQRRLVRAPTNASAPTGKFWRTVTWEQKGTPGFFQVDALGHIRETKDTNVRLCLPVGRTVIRVRACDAANNCSAWMADAADVDTGGEPCE